ncbi:MAG: mobile mystery protein A [bacterium]
MPATTLNFQRLERRQLSTALAGYVGVSRTPRPRDGWIAALREAFDMTVRQFAERLGVSPSNVVRMEQRERDDAITLGTLRRAADALDCDLVYAIVPRIARESDASGQLLDGVIQARARDVAAAQLGRVAHTMALEDQAVSYADLRAQVAERAAALAETPRQLWDSDAAPGDSRTISTRRTRGK